MKPFIIRRSVFLVVMWVLLVSHGIGAQDNTVMSVRAALETELIGIWVRIKESTHAFDQVAPGEGFDPWRGFSTLVTDWVYYFGPGGLGSFVNLGEIDDDPICAEINLPRGTWYIEIVEVSDFAAPEDHVFLLHIDGLGIHQSDHHYTAQLIDSTHLLLLRVSPLISPTSTRVVIDVEVFRRLDGDVVVTLVAPPKVPDR